MAKITNEFFDSYFAYIFQTINGGGSFHREDQEFFLLHRNELFLRDVVMHRRRMMK